LYAVAAVALLPVVACDAVNKDGQQTMATSAVVTLDVYSGKPNPEWSLSDSDAKELLQRIRSLAPAPGGSARPEVLGYRGMEVEIPGGIDGATRFVFSGGTVSTTRQGVQTYYADPGRKTELWLANTGAGHVKAELLKQVTVQIAGKP
jgi:hypothetical protein